MPGSSRPTEPGPSLPESVEPLSSAGAGAGAGVAGAGAVAGASGAAAGAELGVGPPAGALLDSFGPAWTNAVEWTGGATRTDSGRSATTFVGHWSLPSDPSRLVDAMAIAAITAQPAATPAT